MFLEKSLYSKSGLKFLSNLDNVIELSPELIKFGIKLFLSKYLAEFLYQLVSFLIRCEYSLFAIFVTVFSLKIISLKDLVFILWSLTNSL